MLVILRLQNVPQVTSVQHARRAAALHAGIIFAMQSLATAVRAACQSTSEARARTPVATLVLADSATWSPVRAVTAASQGKPAGHVRMVSNACFFLQP